MKQIFYFLWVVVSITAITSCNSEKRLAKKRSKYMSANYEVLKQTLNDAEVIKLQDTIKVIFPNNLMFSVGKSEISEQIFPLFTRFATALNQYQKTNILINGYTDNTGDEGNNQQLSLARSNAAKGRLVMGEVDSARLFTWGHGSLNPIMSNDTEEGRAKNRRVEFVVLYNHPVKKKK